MFKRILLFLALAGYACAYQHWDIQYQYRNIDSILTINDIAFPSAQRGIACGYTVDRKGKERPLVLATSDEGVHWAEIPVKEIGLSLFFLNDSDGWMVTSKSLWVTSESGRSWSKVKAPEGLLQVWFLDRRHGFAAGLDKKVVETKDGGETWTPLSILSTVGGNKTFTTFGNIAFNGKLGIISGWNIPPRQGGPDWMEPERAQQRRQWPNLSVLLQTHDAGQTWAKSESSIFGQITRMSLSPAGVGLGLVEFHDTFEYPSEVYRINLRNGTSERTYRDKSRAITDVKYVPGSDMALLAGFETAGTIYRSPVPGKLRVLSSVNLQDWTEMEVDYRAVAHSAMIAAPDAQHLWIATDTGMILKLVTE